MAHVKDTYRTVTPYLVVPNADAELSFLKAAFGATEVQCQRNTDNTIMHAEVEVGDSPRVPLRHTPSHEQGPNCLKELDAGTIQPVPGCSRQVGRMAG